MLRSIIRMTQLSVQQSTRNLTITLPQMSAKRYTSEEIYNVPEINEIITGYKKEIDMVNDRNLLKQWRKRKRTLREAFEEAEDNVEHLKKRIKKNCDHTDVTEYRQDGWERSTYSYTCNQCKSNVRMWDDFDHTSITKKVDC